MRWRPGVSLQRRTGELRHRTVCLIGRASASSSRWCGAAASALPPIICRCRPARCEEGLPTLNSNLIHRLITRHVDGIRLTAGRPAVFDAGMSHGNGAFGMMRAKEATAPDVSGEVKIAVTEGTGTFWLAPRLVELQRAYPKLLVNLKCLMTPADVSSLEADLAVQLIRPNSPELKVVRLGFLHTMPFAAQSYINTYGLPTSLEELRKQSPRAACGGPDATQRRCSRKMCRMPFDRDSGAYRQMSPARICGPWPRVPGSAGCPPIRISSGVGSSRSRSNRVFASKFG